MSFKHRFGMGGGGSYEDPYIHPWCEECPNIAFNKCPKTHDNLEECRGLYHSSASSPIYTINTTDEKPNKDETPLSDA